MKIRVNETDVVCSHEIKTNAQQTTEIHLTVKAGDVETSHVMTIGAVDEPLPVGYGQTELQNDFDVFRERHAKLAESKLRANSIAKSLQ
jgi:hypothetical protein